MKKTNVVFWMMALVTALAFQALAVGEAGNGAVREKKPVSVRLPGGVIEPWAWESVRDAVDGIADRQELTINYSALNSIQTERMETGNAVLDSRKPLHWKVLLREVLRSQELGFIENDAGIIEVMPFELYHAYKTEAAARALQNNHNTDDWNFPGTPLMVALDRVCKDAGVSLNAGYLPLEIRDPEAAQKSAQAEGDMDPEKVKPVKVYETSFETVTPMEWRNVLKNILDPHGYDFVEIDGAACPMEQSRAVSIRQNILNAKPLVRQVVPIFYADPTDLMARIQELGVLSSRGKITLTQSPNKNTINDGESKLRPRVREDLVVCDVEEHVLQTTEWIRKLDVSDGQVMIEARILAISDDDTKKRGVNWQGYQEEFLKLGLNETTTSWLLGNTIQNWNPQKTPVAATAVQATLNTKQLTAALSLMDEMDNVEQLSHPLIVLGNRTEGSIDVQNIVPVFSTSVQQSGSGADATITTSVEWEDLDVGLEMWICPEISPEGEHVRLSVFQRMSDLIGEPITVVGVVNGVETTIGQDYEISERELDTRAMVCNGDTLVIGGLVTTRNTMNDRKVPLLGDIPYLGRLFSYENRLVEKQNLVIMITPTILDEDTPATGYEPKSEAKAEELSEKGTDYFYNKPEPDSQQPATQQPAVSADPDNRQRSTQQPISEDRDQTSEVGGRKTVSC